MAHRVGMYQLEKLAVWDSATTLARVAYRLTMSRPLSSHVGLADQIRRAAASVPANLAEGYGLGTTKQFIRCIRIALGSCYELRVHLELARDLKITDPKSLGPVLANTESTIRMLIGMLKSLQRR
jgi:four helix bundle protein